MFFHLVIFIGNFVSAESVFENLAVTLIFTDGTTDLVQCITGLEVTLDDVVRPTVVLEDIFTVTTTFEGQNSTVQTGQITLSDSTGKLIFGRRCTLYVVRRLYPVAGHCLNTLCAHAQQGVMQSVLSFCSTKKIKLQKTRDLPRCFAA